MYASSVWDPHLQKHINQLEMVQSRAARFIGGKYSRDPGTVTTLVQSRAARFIGRKYSRDPETVTKLLVEDLVLPTLQEKRKHHASYSNTPASGSINTTIKDITSKIHTSIPQQTLGLRQTRIQQWPKKEQFLRKNHQRMERITSRTIGPSRLWGI